MSLRYAVLGLLARRPSTGYELTRTFDRSLSTSWHARHSQIYPELAKLEGAGLIALVGEGPRGSKTYDITDAGRAELRTWLVDAEPDRSQRSESGLRLFLTPLLDPADRKQTFERDLAHVEHELAALEALRADQSTGAEPEVFAPQVELGVRINSVLRDWLREQIEAASA
ncbi:helix-turn-helix transcriptional regulator [Nocardioides sp. MAHUQ-72]|uniref:PadR family transcriptional regulator n=1 Tax=unclassified Nocardioides TaxID=2615069 RepID=UPI00361108FF